MSSETLEPFPGRCLDISGEHSICFVLDQFCRVAERISGLQVEADGCRR
jgi:hypothetical protein